MARFVWTVRVALLLTALLVFVLRFSSHSSSHFSSLHLISDTEIIRFNPEQGKEEESGLLIRENNVIRKVRFVDYGKEKRAFSEVLESDETYNAFELGQNYTCKYIRAPPGSGGGLIHSGGEVGGCMRCWSKEGDEDEAVADFFPPEQTDEPGSTAFWIHLSLSVVLVMFGGLMSGLTIGLLSLDQLTLKILKESGTGKQKLYADGILPLVRQHHLLLVTLLLCNALAMEALPIFLEALVDPLVAIAISVTAVLMFGEIIPQALCSRYGLAIGYYLRFFVWGLIFLTGILSYPIAKVLDCILGEDHITMFRREELKQLVQHHLKGNPETQTNGSEHQVEGTLDEGEVAVIRGALSMREKKLTPEIFTPLKDVFALDVNSILDEKLLLQIRNSGHSRIPVYRRHKGHIIGVLLAKRLIGLPVGTPLRSMPLVAIPRVSADLLMFDLLDLFKKGRSHMALVLDPSDNLTVLGIITLEDVLETLLESEIYDESDTLGDNSWMRTSVDLAAEDSSGIASRALAFAVSPATLAKSSSSVFNRSTKDVLASAMTVTAPESVSNSDQMGNAFSLRTFIADRDEEKEPLLRSSKGASLKSSNQ